MITFYLRAATAALAVLTSSYALANVVGNDAQNFNPTTNGIDYITVQSSDTLAPGVGNFGLFLNYSVNTLPFLDGATQNFSNKSDRLLSSDWSLGLGLTDGWDIGMNMPYQLKQEISCTACAYFQNTGVTDYKLNSKIRLRQRSEEAVGVALVLYSIFDNTENSPYSGDRAGPSYGAEIAIDNQFSEWRSALNLGHRWRTPGNRTPANVYISRVPNTWTYSAGLSRYFDDPNFGLIFEVFGSSLSQKELDPDQHTNRKSESLEALAGIKKFINHNIAFQTGIGREIIHGFGTPELRIYAGLNWNFGPLWKTSQQPIVSPPAVTASAAPLPETFSPQFSRLTFQNMHFQFNSTELESISEDEYEFAIALIRSDKTIKFIEVEGHTDSIGSAEANQILSEKRAQVIAEKIKSDSGRTEIQYKAVGYGKAQPIDDNRNYQGRLRNRRVVINVSR